MKNAPLKTAVEMIQLSKPEDLVVERAKITADETALTAKKTELDAALAIFGAKRHPVGLAIQQLRQDMDRILDVRQYVVRVQQADNRFQETAARFIGLARDPQLNIMAGLGDSDPIGYNAARFLSYATEWLAVHEPRFQADLAAARELCAPSECADLVEQIDEIVALT